jgi:hypothetical protein
MAKKSTGSATFQANGAITHETAEDALPTTIEAMMDADLERSAASAQALDTDEWDLDALRLSQDFEADLGGKKLLTTVPVRKPKKQEFFRVHPDKEWRFPTAILEVEEDRECFLVAPELRDLLGTDLKQVQLYTALSRSGVLFLWPVRLPAGRQRTSGWLTSAHEAAQVAQRQWIRVTANMDLGAYDIFEATGHFPEPAWPASLRFPDVLKIAFKDRFIQEISHPVLRELRGEA